jgi:hypothetical protein
VRPHWVEGGVWPGSHDLIIVTWGAAIHCALVVRNSLLAGGPKRTLRNDAGALNRGYVIQKRERAGPGTPAANLFYSRPQFSAMPLFSVSMAPSNLATLRSRSVPSLQLAIISRACTAAKKLC